MPMVNASLKWADDELFDISYIALPPGPVDTACNKTRMYNIECIRSEVERFVQIVKLYFTFVSLRMAPGDANVMKN